MSGAELITQLCYRHIYSTHRLAVDKKASLSFVGDVKLATVFQLDHPLSPRDLPSRTFQLEVDINFLTLSRPTKSYLKQIKKIFSKLQKCQKLRKLNLKAN